MDTIFISFLNIILHCLTSFLKKKNTNSYLYNTFKYYNAKPKEQINKKEYYCTRKTCVISLVYIYIYIRVQLCTKYPI